MMTLITVHVTAAIGHYRMLQHLSETIDPPENVCVASPPPFSVADSVISLISLRWSQSLKLSDGCCGMNLTS